jgi:acetyl esterase/lipase
MKFLITAFLLAVIIVSCQKNISSNQLSSQTQLNVPYGTDTAQKMDIYLPAGRTDTSTKVMILIHGGAWASGDKTDFGSFVDTLKKRLPAYAIFNINYRLSNAVNNLFPTQENDVKAAVEFVYSKRSEYTISDKFVLLGASAGGHLALLQGYKYNNPVAVKAVVDFFGPTDMVDLYNNPASPLISSTLVAQIVGATPTSNPALYQQSSPVNYVSSLSPPTIIFHGGMDPLVSPNQSIALAAQLQTAGVVHQYTLYPNGGHGDWDAPTFTDAFDKIDAFLSANVH